MKIFDVTQNPRKLRSPAGIYVDFEWWKSEPESDDLESDILRYSCPHCCAEQKLCVPARGKFDIERKCPSCQADQLILGRPSKQCPIVFCFNRYEFDNYVEVCGGAA